MHRAERSRETSRATRALRMSDLRFCRRHRNTRCLSVKREFQCTRFNAIVKHSRGAVQINVVDISWFTTGVLECETHRACGFVAVFGESNAMISIARRAVTGNFRVDARITSFCVTQFLENINPRAFAENNSGSIE